MYKNLQEDIKNGISLRELVIGFAPMICGKLNRKNELVPRVELRKKLRELKLELKNIEAMNDKEAEMAHTQEYNIEINRLDGVIDNNVKLREKYISLIEGIKQLNVAKNETTEQLQFFALRDINFTMEQACYVPKSKPAKVSGETWKSNKIDALKISIEDYKEAWEQDKVAVKHTLNMFDCEK